MTGVNAPPFAAPAAAGGNAVDRARTVIDVDISTPIDALASEVNNHHHAQDTIAGHVEQDMRQQLAEDEPSPEAPTSFGTAPPAPKDMTDPIRSATSGSSHMESRRTASDPAGDNGSVPLAQRAASEPAAGKGAETLRRPFSRPSHLPRARSVDPDLLPVYDSALQSSLALCACTPITPPLLTSSFSAPVIRSSPVAAITTSSSSAAALPMVRVF